MRHLAQKRARGLSASNAFVMGKMIVAGVFLLPPSAGTQ
jgi:hypothetical protein